MMDLNGLLKNIEHGVDMYDIEEIRLSRALGRAIDECFRAGDQIPTPILEAFAELKKHWDWQMQRELS